MTVRPVVDDAERRRRLIRRHHLDTRERAVALTDVVDDLVGLHATTPSTVYLSAWARVPGFRPEAMDIALYEDRTLVKQLAMRRTLFVFGHTVLAEAIGAVGPRVTASERTNMLRDLRRSPDFDDPEGWIDAARAAVAEDLADGAARTSTGLRRRNPALDGHVIYAADKSWGGRISMGPRVLNMMSAAGEIVRGPNSATWTLSRPSWALMELWLGHPLPAVSVADGHRALIRRWLRAFGPGTEADIVWWLGSTKRAVRAALEDLDAVEVDLDGGAVGYLLPDDLPTGADAALPPHAHLLPELDPTTMGWKERGFYLGPHAERVFDRNGNGGQTAWWDGRIVGGWRQHKDDGHIEVHTFEKLPAVATRALADRAEELGAWLGEARPIPGYPAPFMRG
ncbi:winged helix DNA-binding domain-containing protein [Gordonia sp. HNM0687]|uniref:Winged helix DNA-binding domain-containing protein n=1 Tax=Gordonia mangrovi TaxID=2665643 RepID=A0A6L7GV90_9ACTN|nr:winged helix DNA-binding domain-containing protein [Gordonia mangrovi]MXP23964.1 winged helix DNA-binding domain-containing protein [Gordonia mangrovi]UVF76511.1 winged helix DNA-binding domain-containing protein [Gordonia mangrovi]